MNLAKFDWKLPSYTQEEAQQIKELEEAGLALAPAFLRLCVKRGMTEAADIQQLLEEESEIFHDPFLMHDMQKAVDRIQAAIELNQEILIYGDYDADGITSTLILFESLELMGANVSYYLPNRLTDGYGPNLERYQSFVNEGFQLIITVDNGIVPSPAVTYAMEAGVDVIISDHHQIQAELPPAYAVIHPAHPEGDYPFDDLCGAGVALKIATALLGEVPAEALELVAIGTVADLVSLTDENRTLVKSGLKFLNQTQRIGLQLLLEKAGITDAVTEETIGFTIAPRLNAMGRLGDPSPALELLHTFDEVEAQNLLMTLEENNEERKRLTTEIFDSVVNDLSTADDLPAMIIEANEDWHPGVLGIVASRLVEEYGRPTLLFNYQPENDEYTGSGRSIEGIDLFDWLAAYDQYFSKFGGHDQAVGLSLLAKDYEAFVEAISQTFPTYDDQLAQKIDLTVDLVLDLNEIDQELVESIDRLGPFGTANPKPVVAVQAAEIASVRAVGSDSNHLKLDLKRNQEGDLLGTIGYYMAQQAQGLQADDQVHVVGQLGLNTWQGQTKPQLQLIDIGIDETLWLDQRASQIPADFFSHEESLYVFQSPRTYQQFKQHLGAKSQGLLYGETVPQGFKALVIVEPPEALDDLTQLIHHSNWEKIYLGAFVHQSRYLAGPIQREDYISLYRCLSRYPTFNVQEKLTSLANYLKLPEIKLRAILNVFFQAGFVTINKGQVEFQPNPKEEKVALDQLSAAQAYQSAYEAESLLIYQSLNHIKEYFKKE